MQGLGNFGTLGSGIAGGGALGSASSIIQTEAGASLQAEDGSNLETES